MKNIWSDMKSQDGASWLRYNEKIEEYNTTSSYHPIETTIGDAPSDDIQRRLQEKG